MKPLKYTLLTLSIISVLCFVLFCGTVIVKRFIMKEPLATVAGLATVTIKDGAGSMYPTLSPGDTILIKKSKSYKDGDVVTFYDGSSLVTHRIVEVTEDGYKTKGDNPVNSVDAATVTDDMIFGKMASDGALNGFESFMLSQWGILTIALIFTAGYLAVNAASDGKIKKKKND